MLVLIGLGRVHPVQGLADFQSRETGAADRILCAFLVALGLEAQSRGRQAGARSLIVDAEFLENRWLHHGDGVHSELPPKLASMVLMTTSNLRSALSMRSSRSRSELKRLTSSP